MVRSTTEAVATRKSKHRPKNKQLLHDPAQFGSM